MALLRTVAQVAQCGSMTIAANRLHMTQSAVSQQVRRLEALFAVTIFIRTKQGVQLSADGERLLGKLRALLDHHDELLLAMLAPRLAGVIRFGVPHDLVGTHLPALLKSFSAQHPQVTVALVFGSSVDLRAQFNKGEVDLALIEEHLDAIEGEVMSVDAAVWSGARAGAAWSKRPLPVCFVSATCTLRRPVLAALRRAGVEWVEAPSYPSAEATFATVNADMAVTVWLASLLPEGLQILGHDSGLPPLPSIAITLHRNAADASPASLAMASCIRAYYAPPN